MVPSWLQKALWKVYVPGQERRKDPTLAYLVVQTRCRLAIAEGEGKAHLKPRLLKELRQFTAAAHPQWEAECRSMEAGAFLAWVDSNLGKR